MEFLNGFTKELKIYDDYKEMQFALTDEAGPLVGLGFGEDEIKLCRDKLGTYYYDLLCSIARSNNSQLIDKYSLPMIVNIFEEFESLNLYYTYSKTIKILNIMMKRPLPIDILIYIFSKVQVGFDDCFILISHMIINGMTKQECYDLLTNHQLRDRIIGKMK